MKKIDLQCIQCGASASELYRGFKGKGMKICHCSNCGEVIDKYVEYDPVTIYLDALLLNIRAFRHILINKASQTIWKFTVVILLCETFIKLLQERYLESPSAGPVEPDYVFYSAFEWNLYRNFSIAAVELAIFLAVVVSTLQCTYKIRWREEAPPNLPLVARSLIWSNFGKVIVIPAMLWGQSYSSIYASFSRAYIFASNVQALRVCERRCGFFECVLLVGMAYAMQWGLIAQLPI